MTYNIWRPAKRQGQRASCSWLCSIPLSFSIDLFQIHTKCALGPDLEPQYMVTAHWWHLRPLGGQLWFLLCALYTAEFSISLHQIHTKYSLDQYLDSKPFLSLISYVCGYWGAIFVTFVATGGPYLFSCCKLQTHIFQINDKNGLDQDLDPHTLVLGGQDLKDKGRTWPMQ